MGEFPIIHTDRLRLRGFTMEDAPTVQKHCADPEVARTTLSLPHPYEDGMAEEWIATHQPAFDAGTNISLAMEHREKEAIVGQIDLRPDRGHQHAEIGYLVYRCFWNDGYATEAARALVDYGFSVLGLHRIFAHHFEGNPASGRVLEKCGMKREGVQRKHIFKWGEFRDLIHYGILREDWENTQ